MTEPDIGAPLQWLPKRWYLFALRDEIPLPSDGWTVHLHGRECAVGDGPPSCTTHTCNGLHCRFTRFDGEDPRFALGLQDLSATVAEILGSGTGAEGPDPEGTGLPVGRTVVAVGGAIHPGEAPHEHYRRSFGFARDAVKALRLASQAPIGNLTIERVWPQYFMISEMTPGEISPSVVIVEHGFRGIPEIGETEVAAANEILMGGWQRHPAEIYRDFELGAQNDAYVVGDYPGAVLKAATAAEVLLKHTAWMLQWETEVHLDRDPASAPARFDPFKAKPSELIGTVLSRRLGGNWTSRPETHPVGAWRTYIAQRRNAVIHRGHRPDEHEIGDTTGALHDLEQHILDRLAARADEYPRTALTLAGAAALDKRGALSKLRTITENPQQDPARMLADYNRWLDGKLNATSAKEI